LCNIAIDHAPEESYPDLSVEDLVPDDLLRDLTDAAIPKRKKSATPSPVEDHADKVPDEKCSVFGWELLPPADDAPYGRFQLQVPWKGQERPTSDGNQRCLRRAVATDARLTPLQRSDYLDVFSSLFENHFVDTGSSDVVHLVPSMPVFREHAASTRVRLVLDPSQELNPLCHSGPAASDDYLGCSLLANLHLSRVAPFIITGDISKAFHRISICSQDRPYFGMVFRIGHDLVTAKWRVLIFGANFAPSALTQALCGCVVLADYDSGYLSREEARQLDPVVAQVIDTFDDNRASGDSAATDPASSELPPQFRGKVSIYVDDTQSRGDDIR
ncbi:hypothetical protein FOL46_003334, partial [Perkinsus olseni]